MNTDDESPLASIDLHTWRVPPPVALDRSALLGRALSPETARPKASKWGWLLVAIIVVNAAIATLIVFLTRPDPNPPTTVALPAGGDTDARVRALVQQLEQQQRDIEQRQRELDRRLAEIRQLQTLVQELTKKVKLYEQTSVVPPSKPTPPRKVDSKIESEVRQIMELESRDRSVPDALDRQAIATTMKAIKPTIVACAKQWNATGRAKVRAKVHPDGSIASAVVDAGDNVELGECIAAAVRSAKFPRTNNGGAFSYPFIF